MPSALSSDRTNRIQQKDDMLRRQEAVRRTVGRQNMKNSIRRLTFHGMTLLLLGVSGNAVAAKLLTNTQMAHVTAGSAAAAAAQAQSSVVVPLYFNKPLAQGGSVQGSGSLKVELAAGASAATQIALSGAAQSNLRALVSVNAANSVVQVLLNLTINVNSSVANLSQFNIQIPAAP